MAGLWELVKTDAENRLQTHFIVAAIKGRQANISDNTVGFTAVQIIDALNAMRTADGHPTLTTEETADLSGINTALSGLGTVAARQTYVNLVEAVFVAAEAGQVSEAKWRADLGID